MKGIGRIYYTMKIITKEDQKDYGNTVLDKTDFETKFLLKTKQTYYKHICTQQEAQTDRIDKRTDNLTIIIGDSIILLLIINRLGRRSVWKWKS